MRVPTIGPHISTQAFFQNAEEEENEIMKTTPTTMSPPLGELSHGGE